MRGELADYKVAMPRLITGGLGDFADVEGVMNKTNVGMTDGFDVRAQFEIEMGEDHARLEGVEKMSRIDACRLPNESRSGPQPVRRLKQGEGL